MKRNERKWYENGQMAILDRGDKHIEVEVVGMTGDCDQGVLYVVNDPERGRYTAGDWNMRPVPRKVKQLA